MRKRFLSLALAFAMVLVTGLALTACGGKKDNSMKISLATFNHSGVHSVNFYYLDTAEYQALKTKYEEDKEYNDSLIEQAMLPGSDEKYHGKSREQLEQMFKDEGIFREVVDPYESTKLKQNPNQNYLFGTTWNPNTNVLTENVYSPAKMNQGSYMLVLTLSVQDAYSVGTLQAEVNGETYSITDLRYFEGQKFSYQCIAIIEQEIKSDTVIKLTGSAAVKPFTVEVNLNVDPDFDEGLVDANDGKILFDCTMDNGEVVGKGMTAKELKAALEGKTWNNVLEIVAYDAPDSSLNLMQNQKFVEKFFGYFDFTGTKLKQTIGYNPYRSPSDISFNFSVFDERYSQYQ